MGDFYCFWVFFTNFSPPYWRRVFREFPQTVIGVHTVSGSSVAVGVPADASSVLGVSTVAGLPSAVHDCDVSIVSAAFLPTVLVVLVAGFPTVAAVIPDVNGVVGLPAWCCRLHYFCKHHFTCTFEASLLLLASLLCWQFYCCFHSCCCGR